jgi:hypothetical protein
VFLAGRRAPGSGPRAPAAADLCPATGRGRLSYPRAEYLFKQASAALDPHGKGWTLHQLRHSAPQHLALDGHTAPELRAKSRHQHLASLGRYVRLGEETSARVTAEAAKAMDDALELSDPLVITELAHEGASHTGATHRGAVRLKNI